MLPDFGIPPFAPIAGQLAGLQKRVETLEKQRSGANRLIDSVVLGADVATLTFSNIPNIYDHLLILIYTRSDRANTIDNLAMRFNADAGANYDWFLAVLDTGGVGLNSAVATNQIFINVIDAGTAPANTFSTGTARINNYANGVNHKSCIGDNSSKPANLAASVNRVVAEGHWRDIAAITSITLFPSFGPNLVDGSRFDLYGIQGGP